MKKILNNLKKFWCLEGIVAIIFTIFAISALMSGHVLSAILMTIFSYWWIKRVCSKPMPYKRKNYVRTFHYDRDLDL